MAYNKKKNGKQRKNFKPKNNADMVEMPLQYARELLRQLTYNPRVSSSKKSYTYSVYSKENIIKWLQSPSSATNEKNLRDASNYMYISSMHYSRLLNYYAGLYTGAYVVSPLAFNVDDVKENFIKQYRKVSKALELMNIPHILRQEILVALRDGAFYGVLLNDNNSAFIQKIDPDYCRITSICDGSFLYKVDMTKIASKLEYYPAEFSEMYSNYLKTGDQWQEVPLEISVCIKADDSLVDFTVPPFAAVMPSLYTIANTESLQETATELKNYKMLSGKIPCDDKGNPLMAEDVVKKYYAQVSNALDENVGLALSPFDFKTFNFENNSSTADVDDLSNAVSNFWSTAGTSGLLHGRENDTSGVTKLAIKNDETFVLGMVQQFERVINRYLKTGFTGSTKFKITILPVTVFNKEECLKQYKEAAAFGIGKSHYAAALGIAQNDMAGMDYLEKNLLPFDKLTPLKSSYNMTDNDGAGRPQESDEELGDAGEETRNNDTNNNR